MADDRSEMISVATKIVSVAARVVSVASRIVLVPSEAASVRSSVADGRSGIILVPWGTTSGRSGVVPGRSSTASGGQRAAPSSPRARPAADLSRFSLCSLHQLKSPPDPLDTGCTGGTIGTGRPPAARQPIDATEVAGRAWGCSQRWPVARWGPGSSASKHARPASARPKGPATPARRQVHPPAGEASSQPATGHPHQPVFGRRAHA